MLDELRISRFADLPLEACSLVIRQLTEIGRALIHDARIFLFDEPNSALTEEESKRLFQYMHALKRDGPYRDAGHPSSARAGGPRRSRGNHSRGPVYGAPGGGAR